MLLGLFCVCYHSSFKLWLTTVENRQNWNTVITLHSFRCFFCSFISHYLKESLLLCTVALFRTVILVLLAECGFIVCLLLLRILIISLFSLCIVLGTVQIVWPFHSTIFLSYVICRNCTLCKHTIIKLLFRLGADPWWITLNCVKPACSGDCLASPDLSIWWHDCISVGIGPFTGETLSSQAGCLFTKEVMYWSRPSTGLIKICRWIFVIFP